MGIRWNRFACSTLQLSNASKMIIKPTFAFIRVYLRIDTESVLFLHGFVGVNRLAIG